MPDDDAAAQLDELEALKSIYYPEELQIYNEQNNSVWAWAAPNLPDDYRVRYIDSLDNLQPHILRVKHLPPIQLRVNLPADYPSRQSPQFKIICEWLEYDDIRKLGAHLRQLWKENTYSPIIYLWIEFLKTEALAALCKAEELDVTLAMKSFLEHAQKLSNSVVINQLHEDKSSPESSNAQTTAHQSRHLRRKTRPRKVSVVQIIEASDREQRKANFMKDFHQCKICFSDKQGKDSISFEKCSHVYCKDCLKHYFTVLINEGNVFAIKCPAFKCDSEVNQALVRELVTGELFEKYDRTMLVTMLDTMSDIVYCPRSFCQYPVTWEREDRVAMCPNCRFAFCVYCKMVYHGVEPCRFKADERRQLVEQYQEGSELERRDMEIRYGKKQLESLVNTTLSEFWIKENSKTCPHCNIVIEKSEGCNKMTCWRCQTCFCWLCGARLNSAEPYLHFRDPKSPCVNKLFHLVHDDEDDDWDLDVFEEADSGASDMEGEDSDTDG